MKVIISHDIDHLFWTEHLFDTYILGQIKHSINGGVPSLLKTLKRFGRNRLHNLYELNNFNEKKGIRAHYFVGAKKGLNLSYNIKKFEALGNWLIHESNELGLHGQSPSSLSSLLEEKNRIESLFGNTLSNGIRNHYLKKTDSTLEIMSNAGFTFDSTYYGKIEPFKYQNIWEIPLTIMDCYEVEQKKSHSYNLKKSHSLLQDCLENKHKYFVINFHDIYYNEAFPHYKKWYESLIQECLNLGLNFTTFSKAVNELESDIKYC